MWGTVLDDMSSYRSRSATQTQAPSDNMTHSYAPAAPVSRRISLYRRLSRKHSGTPSVVYSPPPAVYEKEEDPLAAAGAALPSPPLHPTTFTRHHPNDSSATEMSSLHPYAPQQADADPLIARPTSFAPIRPAPVTINSSDSSTPGNERPSLARRPSRRERVVSGLSRTFSRRTSSRSVNDSGENSGQSAGLGGRIGSLHRRSLSRSSSQVVRMATADELLAMDDQRASQRHPYNPEYDYMDSLAYCDGGFSYFNEYDELDYS